MKLKAQILMLVVLVVSNAFSIANSSDNYHQLIIGKWGNSDDSGQTFWGFDEYFADGTLLSTGISLTTYEDWEFKSKYEISGDQSCFTIEETSNSKLLPVGYKGCDKIISIDDKQFKFEDDGKITTIYRVDKSTKSIGDVPADKADDIEKLLKISGAFESMQAIMDNLGLEITSNLARSKPEIPQRVLEKVKNEIDKTVLNEIKQDGGLTLRLIRIYHKHYSHKDIKDIIAFFNTPLGRKLARNTVVITKESEVVGTSWGEKILPVVIDRMLSVLQSEGYDIK